MYTLLLVDDEEATLLGIRALPWEQLCISKVLLAYSAREALEVLETEKEVHVVVTDICMPGKTGVELLSEIEVRGYQTKGLLLSGHADFTYAKQAIRANAVDYLLKPCSDKDLMDAVQFAIKTSLEERQAIVERNQLVAQFSHNPVFLGETLLKSWLQSTNSLETIQQQINKYQLPINLNHLCMWLNIQSNEMKDFSFINGVVAEFLSDFSFQMIMNESSSSIKVLLFCNKDQIEWEKKIRYDQLPYLKKELFFRLKGSCSIQLTEPFIFSDQLRQTFELMENTDNQEFILANKPAAELLVDRVHQFVYQHLDKHPTLQDAADHLNVHAAYLSKIYKDVSGENFSDYTHRLKMENAVHLLVHTNKKINQVATILGYSDSSYFIKVFKKYFSKTPQEFRSG
ncbi:response regulator transcription factor [Alkalicoccobacillus murimartini]|uniref:Two-component system response regulator YesN n=1 Tax=Alkalicoccobacillus murimartini TaxID=171685 RepID=A0ABT9YEU0_9BACI|nr:response regulator [Alkalicoccobacillus murimartini]MDQ0205722.1 two-component system response regulator YesN [Alkalicoccobacillus murimartini]